MKNKKINLIINITKNNKHYAYVKRIENSYNLKPIIEALDENVSTINIIDTFKKAQNIVDEWNNIYKTENRMLSWDDLVSIKL